MNKRAFENIHCPAGLGCWLLLGCYHSNTVLLATGVLLLAGPVRSIGFNRGVPSTNPLTVASVLTLTRLSVAAAVR